MKDKEFNLSDYIQKSNGMGENTMQVRFVKEFIKLLKDKICITGQKRGQDYIDVKLEIEKIIDKLAGEKLI